MVWFVCMHQSCVCQWQMGSHFKWTNAQQSSRMVIDFLLLEKTVLKLNCYFFFQIKTGFRILFFQPMILMNSCALEAYNRNWYLFTIVYWFLLFICHWETKMEFQWCCFSRCISLQRDYICYYWVAFYRAKSMTSNFFLRNSIFFFVFCSKKIVVNYFFFELTFFF